MLSPKTLKTELGSLLVCCVVVFRTFRRSDVFRGSIAWSLTYLFFNLRNSIRTRSPIPLVLSAATTACAGLYGTEYFYFRQNEAVDDAKKRRAQQRFDV